MAGRGRPYGSRSDRDPLRVTREIGVEASGVVVHLAPTPDDPYGLFDNQVVDMIQRRDDIAPEAFERLWRSHGLGL